MVNLCYLTNPLKSNLDSSDQTCNLSDMKCVSYGCNIHVP